MSKHKLIKSASIISAATLLSRIIGFARVIVMAKIFGTGWIAQVFFVAFRMPNMLRDLVAEGASNAAFIPVFSEYLATKSRQDFWRLVTCVFVGLLAVIVLITAFGIVFSPAIVQITAPGFVANAPQLDLTIQMTRVLFIYLILIAIAAFLMAVLNTFQLFLASSLTPSVFNTIMIVAILCSDNSVGGVWKLVVGVMVGGVAQIAMQLPSLVRHGFQWQTQKKDLGLRAIAAHPGVRKIGRLLVPRMFGTALYELNILVDTIFASLSFLVGPDAIAAIFYAARLTQFPLGIFGYSMASASLPMLSEFAAKKEMDKYAQTASFSLTNILFVMIPSGVGLMVLSRPIIKILFERGEFNAYSSAITATALFYYSIGLGANALNKFLTLCFNALHDTKTPVKISGLALVLNVVFISLFTIVYKMRIAGLALASSLSAIICSWLLYRLLQKRIRGFDSRMIGEQILKMLVASAAMAVAVSYAWQSLEPRVNAFVALALIMCVGACAYSGLSYSLGIHQAREFFKWILKKK